MVHSPSQSSQNATQIEPETFFSFLPPEEHTDENDSPANLQVAQYLCEKSADYICLRKYPLVEKLFFKYNAGKRDGTNLDYQCFNMCSYFYFHY